MAMRKSTGLRNQMAGIKRNLIAATDGNFEVGVLATNWTNTHGCAINSSSPISGTYDCKMTADGSVAELRKTAAITVQAGQIYGVQCDAFYFLGAQSLVIQVGTTAGATDITTQTFVLGGTKTTQTAFFRVPDGTTSVYLSFKTSVSTNTYGIEIDNINIYPAAGSIQEIFRKCLVKVYTGSQPTSPDDVPSGTILCTYASDGNSAGDTWDDATAGVLPKAVSETWSGTAVNTGTAGWARIIAIGDTAASSTTECRIDGACATSGAEFTMTSTSITTGTTQTVSSGTITVPI